MVEIHYSLIQYRGDIVRREAVNLGVVAIGPDGDARIQVDRFAHRRLEAFGPNFDRRVYSAFVRDLSRCVGADHQMYLGEQGSGAGAAAKLAALALFNANQIGLTEPRPYNAGSALEAVRRLYSRLVGNVPLPARQARHMTQAGVRRLIGDTLEHWARARVDRDLSIQSQVQIRGRVTTHTADLVAYAEDEPRLVFFAAPLLGQQAPLIRDSLPTRVADLQDALPRSQFFAVLGDSGVDINKPDNPADIARRLLGQVPGLNVLGVSELKERFAPPDAKLEPANS